MKTLKNFQRTAEIFFFFIGLLYVAAILFWKNEVFVMEVEWFLEIADIPFLFICLCYFLGSIRLSMEEKYRIELMGEKPNPSHFSFLNTVLFSTGLALFIFFIFLDIVAPIIENS